MANTTNVAIIETANTFDHWRIRDNLQANDVNEIARGNFVKLSGSINIAEGTLTLANASGGVILTVKDDARVDGLFSVDTIETDSDGHVYISAGDITMGNRAAGGLFQANINTKFDSANVEFSNGNVFFSNASATGIVVIRPNTNFLTSISVSQSANITTVNADTFITTAGLNVTDQANAARLQANTARDQANSARDQANTARDQANTARDQANTARTLANSAANTVATFANGTLVLAAGNLNFNNTSTLNVDITANGTTQTNVALTVNANAITQLGTLTGLNVSGVANVTTIRSDDIKIDSNASYYILNGNGVFNNLDVKGNLVIIGTSVTDTDTLLLRASASTDDNGIVRVKRGSTGKGNAELRFLAASDVWQATANANGTPSHYTIVTTQNVLDSVVSTSLTNVGAANAVKTSYDQASNARDQANTARTQANTARDQANTARDQANTARTTANDAYGQANTAGTNALNAYGQANNARDQANTARDQANTARTTANDAYGTANTAATNALNAYGQANTARTTANNAYDAANNRILKAGDTATGTISYTAANAIFSTGNVTFTSNVFDTPILSVTGSATYGDNAAGKIIFSNTTSAITITIGAAAVSGFSYTIVRGNTGNVTIANVSSVTRLNSAAMTSLNVTQYAAATIVYTATNQVIVFGDFVA